MVGQRKENLEGRISNMDKWNETERPSNRGLLNTLRSNYPDSLLANGYDSAILGVASGNDTGRVVYSIPKMIQVCMKELAVDYEEALEWLEYNTFNAYVGELTPIYLDEIYAL